VRGLPSARGQVDCPSLLWRWAGTREGAGPPALRPGLDRYGAERRHGQGHPVGGTPAGVAGQGFLEPEAPGSPGQGRGQGRQKGGQGPGLRPAAGPGRRTVHGRLDRGARLRARGWTPGPSSGRNASKAGEQARVASQEGKGLGSYPFGGH